VFLVCSTTDGAADEMRPFWNAFGWIAQGLFAFTVYYLFWFLRGVERPAPTTTARALAIDALLAAQFALLHSTLLLPPVRKLLTRWIPSPAYGVCYCAVTCVSLLAAIWGWQPCGDPVWDLQGAGKMLIRGAFYGSWAMLLYSLYLSGFGNQTGWSSWWPWVRGDAVPKRKFQPRSIFLLLRHPVYLSFLGLVWFVPCMTIDRATLTAVWTVYVFVGSYLKDRRMVHYVGMAYRQYQAEVPGYPGMLAGPLGRLSLPLLADERAPVA
jgi:protein-S-isoprenylcysteine O-methyltransferase Ste14